MKNEFHSHKYECGCTVRHYKPLCPLPYKIEKMCGQHEQFMLFGDPTHGKGWEEALDELWEEATKPDS